MMMPPLAGRMWKAFQRKTPSSPSAAAAAAPTKVTQSLSNHSRRKFERVYSFEDGLSPDVSAKRKPAESFRSRWKADSESRALDQAMVDEEDS